MSKTLNALIGSAGDAMCAVDDAVYSFLAKNVSVLAILSLWVALIWFALSR